MRSDSAPDFVRTQRQILVGGRLPTLAQAAAVTSLSLGLARLRSAGRELRDAVDDHRRAVAAWCDSLRGRQMRQNEYCLRRAVQIDALLAYYDELAAEQFAACPDCGDPDCYGALRSAGGQPVGCGCAETAVERRLVSATLTVDQVALGRLLIDIGQRWPSLSTVTAEAVSGALQGETDAVDAAVRTGSRGGEWPAQWDLLWNDPRWEYRLEEPILQLIPHVSTPAGQEGAGGRCFRFRASETRYLVDIDFRGRPSAAHADLVGGTGSSVVEVVWVDREDGGVREGSVDVVRVHGGGVAS